MQITWQTSLRIIAERLLKMPKKVEALFGHTL
jgi:hypothetical protein